MEGKAIRKDGLPHWVEVISEYEKELSGQRPSREENTLHDSHPCSGRGLYGLMLRRLKELETDSPSGIIRFPKVFEKLCRNFSISKEECWELLFLLRDSGFIELIPYQGIRLVIGGHCSHRLR